MKIKLLKYAKVQKGFSFVELIIVIAIIVLIAVFSIPKITDSMENSRKTKDVTNARLIGTTVTKVIDKEDSLSLVAGTYRFEASVPTPQVGATSEQTNFAIQLGKELNNVKFAPLYKGTLPTAKCFVLVIEQDGSIEVSVGATGATIAGTIILFPTVDSSYEVN